MYLLAYYFDGPYWTHFGDSEFIILTVARVSQAIGEFRRLRHPRTGAFRGATTVTIAPDILAIPDFPMNAPRRMEAMWKRSACWRTGILATQCIRSTSIPTYPTRSMYREIALAPAEIAGCTQGSTAFLGIARHTTSSEAGRVTALGRRIISRYFRHMTYTDRGLELNVYHSSRTLPLACPTIARSAFLFSRIVRYAIAIGSTALISARSLPAQGNYEAAAAGIAAAEKVPVRDGLAPAVLAGLSLGIAGRLLTVDPNPAGLLAGVVGVAILVSTSSSDSTMGPRPVVGTNLDPEYQRSFDLAFAKRLRERRRTTRVWGVLGGGVVGAAATHFLLSNLFGG